MRVVATTWWAAAMAMVAALLIAAPARAGLGGPTLPVCVARAAMGDSAAALFDNPGRFDCRTSQRAFGPGDYWVLSGRVPAGSWDVVRTSSVWQDRVTLYVRYADGAIRSTGFTSGTTGRHLRMGTAIEVAIPPHPAAPVRLLWHVEGAGNLRGILLGPVVGTHVRSDHLEVMLAAFYACFLGVIGGLLIHNLALLAALRQPFQLAYCAMLTMLIGYAFSTSGMLGQLAPWLDNNDRQRMNWVLLGWSAAAVLVFAQLFFERRVFVGWLARASHFVAGALIATPLIAAIVAPWQIAFFDGVVTASYVLLLLLVPVILVQAWRRRSDYLWLFAIAWGVPIVMASLRTAHALHLLEWRFWLDQSTILSLGLEALLSSIGITCRLRLLQRQRDDARAGEQIARTLADTDPLTGLLNRRAFLHHAIGRSGPQTLLLADLDHFKAVNETIGHDGGDEVLRCFARTLEAAVPDGALIARIGGEEFAVVAAIDAGLTPSAVLQALRAARMPFDLAVTTSIGTCNGPLMREIDWKRLYREADRALYAAKAAGRDRARDAATLPIAA